MLLNISMIFKDCFNALNKLISFQGIPSLLYFLLRVHGILILKYFLFNKAKVLQCPNMSFYILNSLLKTPMEHISNVKHNTKAFYKPVYQHVNWWTVLNCLTPHIFASIISLTSSLHIHAFKYISNLNVAFSMCYSFTSFHP